MADNNRKNLASEEGEIDEIVIVLFSDEEIARMNPPQMEALDRALSNSNPSGEKWCRQPMDAISRRSRTTSTATRLSNGVHRKITPIPGKTTAGNNARKTFPRQMPYVQGKLSETAAKFNTVFDKCMKSFT